MKALTDFAFDAGEKIGYMKAILDVKQAFLEGKIIGISYLNELIEEYKNKTT